MWERRRMGREALNLHGASFASNSERQSFVHCTVRNILRINKGKCAGGMSVGPRNWRCRYRDTSLTQRKRDRCPLGDGTRLFLENRAGGHRGHSQLQRNREESSSLLILDRNWLFDRGRSDVTEKEFVDAREIGATKRDWGHEEGADHRKSYLLDEIKQRKLLFYMCILCEGVLTYRAGPISCCSEVNHSMAEPHRLQNYFGVISTFPHLVNTDIYRILNGVVYHCNLKVY
ncbi:hypothetical protein EVAR_45687_1 [Eumeta japonica]|uniref:Uncharacterized protein n=1 Tax=Eumeta variegata TaxID=151549 RepID=A0A4C1XMM0_EUMVA|nr:hypothetical protein EVAR_45687_1 [Eumeta japonica]